MRKLLLLVYILGFACCNNAAKSHNDEIETAIRSYLEKALIRQQAIDSFSIVSVDTVSGEELLKRSVENFENRLARSNFMIEYARGDKLREPDANEEQLHTEISEMLQHKLDSCQKLLKKDMKSPGGYFVKTFHIETENGKEQWRGELQFLLDKEMKVWEYEPGY